MTSRSPSVRRRWLACAAPLALVLCVARASGADVLEVDDRSVAFGVSAGGGWSGLAGPKETTDLGFAQIGFRALLWGRFEAALDLRADFAAAPEPGDGPVASYLALAWIIGHLDLLPLAPFVGVGGGASLPPDFGAVVGTVGACAGLSLWFRATWRLTLRAAQRWNFDENGSIATDVGLTGEWFF